MNPTLGSLRDMLRRTTLGGRALFRLTVLPSAEPVEQRDDRTDQDDRPDRSKGVSHGSFLPRKTVPRQAAPPT